MSDSSHDSSSANATEAEPLSVPSPNFFEDIKFYICGNVLEKVLDSRQLLSIYSGLLDFVDARRYLL